LRVVPPLPLVALQGLALLCTLVLKVLLSPGPHCRRLALVTAVDLGALLRGHRILEPLAVRSQRGEDTLDPDGFGDPETFSNLLESTCQLAQRRHHGRNIVRIYARPKFGLAVGGEFVACFLQLGD
jgi:hypothetical protein